MDQFKLKYEKLNCDEFYSQLIPNKNNSKVEKLFNDIITPKDFKNSSYEKLIQMKCALLSFDPIDPKLKRELDDRFKQIQKVIEEIFDNI